MLLLCSFVQTCRWQEDRWSASIGRCGTRPDCQGLAASQARSVHYWHLL